MGKNEIKALTKGILRKNMGSRIFVYLILLLFFLGDIVKSIENTPEKIVQGFQAFPYTAIGLGLSIVVILHMIRESGRQEDLVFIPQTKKTRFWANTLAYFITLCEVQVVGLILYFLQYGIQVFINSTYEVSWMYYSLNMLEIVSGLFWYQVMGMSIVSVMFLLHEWCQRWFISFVVGMVFIFVGALYLLNSGWFYIASFMDFLTAEQVSYLGVMLTLLLFQILTFSIAYFLSCNRRVRESKLLRKKTVKQYVWLIASLCYFCVTIFIMFTIFNNYDEVGGNNSVRAEKETVIYIGEKSETENIGIDVIPDLVDVRYEIDQERDLELGFLGLSREENAKLTENSVVLSYRFISHLFGREILDDLNISVKAETTYDSTILVYVEYSPYRYCGITPFLGMNWFYPNDGRHYNLSVSNFYGGAYSGVSDWVGEICIYGR